ncbi:MAG: hypothetical protein GF308_20780 [Candidatus Heimdallarchaeota archaeon]|nr:hypothetical protein [Candidatus Heimdallarchaeota archaeon]
MMDLVKVPKGAVLDAIKEETGGLKIANEIKEEILEYFQEKLTEEVKRISQWAKDVAELQEKRTIMPKDWDFIMKKIKEIDHMSKE